MFETGATPEQIEAAVDSKLREHPWNPALEPHVRKRYREGMEWWAQHLVPPDKGIYDRADVEALLEFYESAWDREMNHLPETTTKRLHDAFLTITSELIERCRR